ncbi:MAG: hypothetical protein RQM92_06485 [Candidatus Syntrophopropionicum ammoniitolerans]
MGTLVSPDHNLILLTPICPHSLWARPVVTAPDSVIKVAVLSDGGAVTLTIDGQYVFSLRQNDEIVVRQAPRKQNFCALQGGTFLKYYAKS